MPTYKIENKGARPQGFRVRGGIEVVKTNQTRVLDVSDELTDDVIDDMKERGISVSESGDDAENTDNVVIGKPLGERDEVGERRRSRRARRAQDPAETGGVVPQSEKSEKGGVERKPGDTTTTTKPTEKQIGPVA